MFYGCPKENSFPSFVDAPKAPKSFLFFCLLRRKILFHGFSDFFRRLVIKRLSFFCLLRRKILFRRFANLRKSFFHRFSSFFRRFSSFFRRFSSFFRRLAIGPANLLLLAAPTDPGPAEPGGPRGLWPPRFFKVST